MLWKCCVFKYHLCPDNYPKKLLLLQELEINRRVRNAAHIFFPWLIYAFNCNYHLVYAYSVVLNRGLWHLRKHLSSYEHTIENDWNLITFRKFNSSSAFTFVFRDKLKFNVIQLKQTHHCDACHLIFSFLAFNISS